MAGIDGEFDGTARLTDGFRAGYLPQEPQLTDGVTVRENIEAAVAEKRRILDQFQQVSQQLGEVADPDQMERLCGQLERLQNQIDSQNLWDLDRQLQRAADAMNLPDPEAEVSRLSGGERRRVALCKILLEQPDLLLLDEPTNHLDADAVAWLERHLAEYPGTVVAVTHDRYFLDNVAGWILELDRGQGYPFEGNYSAWLEAKAKRMEQAERQDKARARVIAAELEWVRTNPKGRRKKNKARLSRYEELVA